MIHYHGGPMTGPADNAVRFYAGRHAMVSFAHPPHLSIVADVCQSFVLDNGAFSFWRSGKPLDPEAFADFVFEWKFHPSFEWCLIPDVIDGTESQNDALISDWVHGKEMSVPVWHLHESLGRLSDLSRTFPRVALGSSGEYAKPGDRKWWGRMAEAMKQICVDGKPQVKLHGLRMLDPDIFGRLPLASADSCNAVINCKHMVRYGMYPPPTDWQRAIAIADRIESVQSAPVWSDEYRQAGLFA